MIDFAGLPVPEDAPRLGSCVRLERPERALALVVLDPPHRSPALLDLPLLRDLDAVLDELETSPELSGVVFTGRAPLSFAAGVDLEALAHLRDPELAARVIGIGQELLRRIEQLRERGVRTVAAVGGLVAGGAYELCLACGRIVLADDPQSRVGLPETQLGSIPAWGATRRLPRRVGVPTALRAILEGRLWPAARAHELGFVDRLTPPEYLVRVAGDIAAGRTSCRARTRGAWGWLVDRNPLLLVGLERRIRRAIARRTRGLDEAALAAARLVPWGALRPLARGLAAERRAAARLVVGEAFKNRLSISRQLERARRLDGAPPEPIARAAVLGAGVMGGAIASALAEHGLATRLYDVDAARLDAAVGLHRAELAERRERRRLLPHQERAALDRLDPTAELVGFGRTELVVEAVVEDLATKREALGALARLAPEDAILATNTSSLSVSAVFEGLPRPERALGLHFFNPVRKMPLVELVRGEHTDEETLARAAALVVRLGKTPIVVADVPGFLVNRLLVLYLDEALRLYAGGVEPERLERAALDFGLPLGPLRLLDEIGLDVAARGTRALHEAYGERMKPCAVLEPLLAAKHLGRKTGDGFYVHLSFAPRAEPRLSTDLRRLSPPTSSHEEFLTDEELVDRLLLPMLAEAIRCLEEGVVASPAELDLACVLGFGFPAFRGGLLRWADDVGPGELLERYTHCATAISSGPKPERRERYATPERLRSLAAKGGVFREDRLS